MALSVSQIITLTREVIGDLGIDSDTWTDTQVIEGIHYAVTECARKTAFSYTEAAASVTSGSAGIPADCIRVTQVMGPSGYVADKTTRDFVELMDPYWRTGTGPSGARRWFYETPSSLGVHPPIATVTLGYIQQPVSLTAGSSIDTRLNDYYHFHLKYAAAAYLLSMNSDAEDVGKAEALMKQFNSLIGAGPDKVSVSIAEE